jgi:hypothetical protein
MTVVTLFSGVTKTNTIPPVLLKVEGIAQGQPPANQAFQAVVSGSGNVSATVQPVVSNDGVNFSNFGTAITISSAFGSANGIQATSQSPFSYYGGIVTAISGTNATVMLNMSY